MAKFLSSPGLKGVDYISSGPCRIKFIPDEGVLFLYTFSLICYLF